MRCSALALLLLCATLSVAPLSLAADKGGSGSASSNARQDEARIPFKSPAETDGVGLTVRVVGGFIVVALLALVSVYTLKRFFPSFYAHSASGSKRIRVLEIRRLTPRASLFLVELDGVNMLLAQSGDRIVRLHRTPASQADSDNTRVGS